MIRFFRPAVVVLLVAVFLAGCGTAPPPPDADPVVALEQALTESIPISGEAAAGPDSWEFTLVGTSFDTSTGAFTAQIEWPTLNAIHLADGTLIGDLLQFEEVDYVQQGDAILNCQYVARILWDQPRVEGTWGGCMGYEGTFWIVIP